MAIDAQVRTSEAHDLYEQLNLTKWQDKHTSQRQHPEVTHLNVTLADYYKYHAPNHSCLLHLRVEGTQPYKLPKLNADVRTGKYDTTLREAIQLLPYQTFDLIIPLLDRALVPHISTEPARVTIIGQITPTCTPLQTTSRPTNTQEHAYPSPPRSYQTSINLTTEAPPDLPAFPVLRSTQAAPEPQSTQERGQRQPTQEQLTPTVYFKINEPREEQPNNGASPEAKQTSPPKDIQTKAAGIPNRTPEIQISDDEGDKEPQDVEMEPAGQHPHNAKERTETSATTMKDVLELQRRLRPETEQGTHTHTKCQQSTKLQGHEGHRQNQESADRPSSADPIQTSTPNSRGSPPSE